MKVSIIIPNYNGEELLRKNLPKVFDAAAYFAQKEKEAVEIIVVDDCSIDNSVDCIKEQVLSMGKNVEVKVVKNDKNLGFAQTVNRGVKEAGGDIVVLLNTDVAPNNDFLKPLLDHFNTPDIFAIGCMDESIEGGKIVLRGRGLGKWERGFLVHRRGEIDKTNTLWASGGSGAFRKSLWEKIGGFNALYAPFYWEDIDLSYRALKCGYQIAFEPKSIVVHEHEKGAIKTKYKAQEIKIVAYKNQFLFVWLNITDTDLLFQHLFWLPYHFLFFAYKRELVFFLGFFKAFSLLPLILFARFKNKKIFKENDKAILHRYLET